MRSNVLTVREKTLAMIAGILLMILVVAGYLTSNDSSASVLSLGYATGQVSVDLQPAP